MKPVRKPKYGRWLLIAVLVFLVGMYCIAWLPAPIEGSYGYETTCMCGGKSIMRFTKGKVVYYNTEHPPGEMYADYVLLADGKVEVTPLPEYRRGSDTKENNSWIVVPRLFFLQIPKQPRFPDGGVEFRLPEISTVSRTTTTHPVIRKVRRENGSLVTETYSPGLALVRSEVAKPDTNEDK